MVFCTFGSLKVLLLVRDDEALTMFTRIWTEVAQEVLNFLLAEVVLEDLE
jgi:hypothetical protein